ncbi:hypothetical protein ZIOFF_048309 [Zingiber officinale]|uniref:dihydrolipoyllysine-residue (2-methylpropanoyl)transferase n=1 Tax=Zingiber officinale TaxID=94328 RepID=A0A8J5FWC9_ZINOF|nr:hypothetical protein ZIOFF_048309 [Zingiber officinale]
MIPRRSTRSLLLTAASRVSRLPSAAATNPYAALLRPPPDTSESESGPFRSVLSSFLPFSPLRAGSSRSFAYWSSAERVCVRFCNRRLSSQARVDAAGGEVVDVPLAQTGEGIAECELLKWFVSEVGETLVKIQVDDSQTPFTSAGDINVTSGGVSLTDPDSPISPKAEASGGVLSTPAVRNLAKELGLVLNDIPGTGKDGRILKEDVLTYATSKGHCKEQSFSSDSIDGHTNELELLNQDKGFYEDNVGDVQHEDKIIPVRGFQRSMVKSMTMAAKVPHFHYVEEINFDALVELKTAFQTANKDQNVKHTYLPFLIKSLSMALNKYPLLNSSFNDETNEIFLKGYHNIGIAMATTYGLVVPNIKKVQSLTILEITKELARLQQMASSNKLNTEDITGGTLTLSNIGAVGGKFGSPLLNLPEVAIIAIGQIRRLPRFDDDDNIYPASVASVTVGADHRIVDGATVARFCNEWKLLIEKPELLLLHMK